MNYTKLVPGIERRLSTWVNVHDQLATKSSIANKISITLSREYGCEAYPLAEELEKRLEGLTGEKWHIFDHAIITAISKSENLSEQFLDNLGSSSHIFDVIMADFINTTSHDDAYKKIVEYILKVAQFGNAIIVGRGSGIITQKLDNCFHFRLEAPEAFRISSIENRLHISSEEARAIVIENQTKRERYISKYFGTKVSNHELYDAVFNNQRMSVEKMAQSIIAAVIDGD
jgi:cytidylate kinase